MSSAFVDLASRNLRSLRDDARAREWREIPRGHLVNRFFLRKGGLQPGPRIVVALIERVFAGDVIAAVPGLLHELADLTNGFRLYGWRALEHRRQIFHADGSFQDGLLAERRIGQGENRQHSQRADCDKHLSGMIPEIRRTKSPVVLAPTLKACVIGQLCLLPHRPLQLVTPCGIHVVIAAKTQEEGLFIPPTPKNFAGSVMKAARYFGTSWKINWRLRGNKLRAKESVFS